VLPPEQGGGCILLRHKSLSRKGKELVAKENAGLGVAGLKRPWLAGFEAPDDSERGMFAGNRRRALRWRDRDLASHGVGGKSGPDAGPARLEDPRSHVNQKHLLGDLIVICVCGVSPDATARSPSGNGRRRRKTG